MPPALRRSRRAGSSGSARLQSRCPVESRRARPSDLPGSALRRDSECTCCNGRASLLITPNCGCPRFRAAFLAALTWVISRAPSIEGAAVLALVRVQFVGRAILLAFEPRRLVASGEDALFGAPDALVRVQSLQDE